MVHELVVFFGFVERSVHIERLQQRRHVGLLRGRFSRVLVAIVVRVGPHDLQRPVRVADGEHVYTRRKQLFAGGLFFGLARDPLELCEVQPRVVQELAP